MSSATRPGAATTNLPSPGLGAFGYGPLDPWLEDATVSEVLVNAGGDVWVERGAGRTRSGPQYVGRLAPGVVEAVLERMLAPAGRRIDRTSPVVDARLPDGSRLCAVLPPVAVDGPCLAVRRFLDRPLALDAFAGPDVVDVLDGIVADRCNVLVSGATSSGKTTLLNALAARVAPHERIITLEDTAELDLPVPHVLRLEARPATPDGVPAVDMAALVRTALRLRPDRLVVGEVRGAEAIDLVQAFNTGHDGSLTTLHANSPADALARLESLVVQSGAAWPLEAVRRQVHRSIDVVVHVHRDVDGRRSVTEVAEVAVDPLGRSGPTLTLATPQGVVAPRQRSRR
jgi:pilus assembly protein CpaF